MNPMTDYTRQFERVYAQCGSYYDRPILQSGEKTCDCCGSPYIYVKTDQQKNVCDHCLKDGKVKKCNICQIFVFNNFYFEAKTRMDQLRFPNLTYCDKCKPSIIFTFNIGPPYSTQIDIPIPKDKEWGLPFDYFLKQIAERLQINPHNLSIENFYFGSKYDDQKKIMCCPAEYIEAKDKIFNVNIV